MNDELEIPLETTLLRLGDSSRESFRSFVKQDETRQLKVVEAPQPLLPNGQAPFLTQHGEELFVRVVPDSAANLSMIKRSIYEQIPSMDCRVKFSCEGVSSEGKEDKTASFCVMSALHRLVTVYQDVFYKEHEVSNSSLPPVYFDVIHGANPTRILPSHRSQ